MKQTEFKRNCRIKGELSQGLSISGFVGFNLKKKGKTGIYITIYMHMQTDIYKQTLKEDKKEKEEQEGNCVKAYLAEGNSTERERERARQRECCV